MEITLQGKQFPLRGSMRAIQECQQKEGIELHKLEGLVDTSTMLYYFAKHGARHEGEPFKLSLAEWLDMIELHQVKYLGEVLTAITGGEPGEDGKKKE